MMEGQINEAFTMFKFRQTSQQDKQPIGDWNKKLKSVGKILRPEQRTVRAAKDTWKIERSDRCDGRLVKRCGAPKRRVVRFWKKAGQQKSMSMKKTNLGKSKKERKGRKKIDLLSYFRQPTKLFPNLTKTVPTIPDIGIFSLKTENSQTSLSQNVLYFLPILMLGENP